MSKHEANGICICGLNGSGKTTLGRLLAERLEYQRMDVEDYYFPDGEAIPYSTARSREEVCKRLRTDMEKHPQFVFSAVNGDMGEDVTSHYRLVVYLYVPLKIRAGRIRKRAFERFGARVEPGGDMYEQEQEFFAFAVHRTPEKIERWLETLSCDILRLDGTARPEVNVEKICAFLQMNK